MSSKDYEELKKELEDLNTQLKEYEKRLEKKNIELDENKAQMLRLQADFENYKKQSARQMQDQILYANEKLILKVLDAYEDLQRALNAKKAEDIKEGVELIYKKLTKILEEEGLEVIPTENEKFDPFKHEALMAEDNEEFEDGYIIQELGKGYTLNSKVIKYSKVKVCKKSENNQE